MMENDLSGLIFISKFVIAVKDEGICANEMNEKISL